MSLVYIQEREKSKKNINNCTNKLEGFLKIWKKQKKRTEQ